MKLLTSPFGSMGHALKMTLEAAHRSGDRHIDIPFGEYHIYQKESSSAALCVSNHGYNGYKHAALLIENFDGLTVDGNGSTFILHGCMDFAIIHRSKAVTLKNMTVTCADTCNFQGKVLSSSESCVEIALSEHPPITVHGTVIYQQIEHQSVPLTRTLEYVTETRKLRRGLGDKHFGISVNSIRKNLVDDTLYLYDVPVPPETGNTIVFVTSCRINQAFFTVKSKDILLENITVRTCWGMAFIAQKSENITIRGCKVLPEGDRCFSAGQDATHFVNCRGKIVIEDSVFENQLDDAVNLHGIYTRIEKIAANQIMVEYKHFQTTGIDIYEKGDRIQILEQESQMPLAEATVTDAEVLNPHSTLLTLDALSPAIKEGMIVESLSDSADALIRNNVFRNNRARGMLLASKGEIRIENNHFNSSGAAIQFESDPFSWYESGGTCNVIIRNNFFDDCKYGAWGRGVIDICKRRKEVEGFYYHDRIEISENRFTQTEFPCVRADNVGDLIFDSKNTFLCKDPIIVKHCILNGEKYN